MSTQDDDERKLSPFPKPLSSTHIVDAFKHSPDAGVTVVLSKLGISDIGSPEAEELANARQHGRQETASIVERLALGNNRLSSLPPKFSLFTKLRYLNLKHNSFTIFPDVLTLVPSLDTLDLSHNRIKKLPSHPGNLVRLRVLCLSRNKIARLPLYIAQFHSLEVLQIDRNPWEWPPRAIIENLSDVQYENNGKDWIRNLYTWMEADVLKGGEYDDSGYSEQPEWEDEPPSTSWRFPQHERHFDAGPTPHARSFSIDSNTSISSIPDPSHELDINEHNYIVKRRAGPSPNYTGRFASSQSEMPGDVISEHSYTSSPTGTALYEGPPETEPMHSRTMSHASTLRKPHHSFVAGKKSLPDLRNAHKNPAKRIPALPEEKSPSYLSNLSEAQDPSSFPSNPLRQDSGSSSGSLFYPTSAYPEDLQPSDTGALAAERNSYFHRSSTIIINHSLPRSLLRLLESARNILFAMGQLYQTIEHYVHQGVDERLSSMFRKVLDPANVNMLHLIRSLDRFDDVSQKAIPSPAVCRGLVESCRDTIATFRKAVGLLTLQIDLDDTEDARFVRWLILELYGTTTELSFAWQAMVPEIESVKPFLYGSVFSGGAPFSFGGELDSLMSFNPPYHSEDTAPVVRLRPTESLHSTLGTGRIRTARRHAGSFSSKDVEIGKELPSYDILPSMGGGLATHTPTLRTPKRLMTVPIVTTSTSSPSSYASNPSSSYYSFSPANLGLHLRTASQSSLLDSSSLTSPATSIDSAASNKSVINREVLHSIQTAVEIAPTVWEQIEETLGDIAHVNRDIRENLERARSVTRRLSKHVFDMLEGEPEADRKVLREDAHLFLKVIVQLSNILKTHGNPRSVSTTLRSNMDKLTNCTEEFAILLHVSSVSFYAPSSSSQTFPSQFTKYDGNPKLVEDNQLGSSLSRSRSAQPSLGSAKQSISTPYDDPQATPFLTTKPLSVRRLRVVRDVSIDKNEPG